jgi:pimeloyl-ACP methyl ester carboxylesterase
MAAIVRPVVVTLHGIRTRGEWQKRIAPLIASRGMIPVLLDYGYFNVFQFLNPWSRDKRVKWLRDEVAAVRNSYPHAPISLVGHSLGTFLIARLIEEETAFNFETVLFSGSIVRTDYPWKRLLIANRVNYVANYIAKKDVWPGIAKAVIGGAGRAGVDGFSDKHSALFQHTHPRYGHSDYFNPHTFESLWLPKLTVPQRSMIECLNGLLIEATQVLKTAPATADCLLRARVFYRTRDADTFRQFPGMHVATHESARYSDDELDYALTSAAGVRPASSPPAFQAAFTQKPTQWSAIDDQHHAGSRADVVAAVAAPLPDEESARALGMVALEAIASDPHNAPRQASGLKPLLAKLSEHATSAGVTIRTLFPKDWSS